MWLVLPQKPPAIEQRTGTLNHNGWSSTSAGRKFHVQLGPLCCSVPTQLWSLHMHTHCKHSLFANPALHSTTPLAAMYMYVPLQMSWGTSASCSLRSSHHPRSTTGAARQHHPLQHWGEQQPLAGSAQAPWGTFLQTSLAQLLLLALRVLLLQHGVQVLQICWALQQGPSVAVRSGCWMLRTCSSRQLSWRQQQQHAGSRRHSQHTGSNSSNRNRSSFRVRRGTS